jgi:hypothetical protein
MGTTKAVSKAAAILGRKGGKVGGKATGASKRRSRMTYRCETCDREVTPAEYEHLADGEAMACPNHPAATILSCPDPSAYYKALRAAPRMRLTVAASGHVTISYQGPDGLQRERTFSANSDTPVYVREHRHDGTTTQPCEELASTGSTLRASRSTLADVIRREYRAMRAAEKRYRYS